jgi:hypothetical protein
MTADDLANERNGRAKGSVLVEAGGPSGGLMLTR